MKIFVVDNVFILAVVKTLAKDIVNIYNLVFFKTPTHARLVVECRISVNNGLKFDQSIWKNPYLPTDKISEEVEPGNFSVRKSREIKSPRNLVSPKV